MHSPSLLLQAALGYAARGWRVLPLHTPTGNPERPCSCGAPLDDQGKPTCAVGKHPRIKAWPEQATVDEGAIRKWWGMWPEANVGIATGRETGWFALDVDGEPGAATLRRLEEANSVLPRTPEQITGSGGKHRLFRWAPGLSNAVEFAPRLDIRTDGGLIVAEPSVHPNGREYLWNPNAHPDDLEIPPAPPWLLAAIRKAGAKQGASAAEVGQTIPEGHRDSTLASVAGSMRRRGADASEIEAALLVMNRNRCKPPLPESEVRKIAVSVGRYAPGSNGVVPTEEGTFVVNVVPSLANREEEPPSELEPEAYHGLAGQVVLSIEPHTESSPAAVLASFLVGAGVLIGRGPYIYRDGARHCVNEFACLVGMTAVGRKGTATRRTDEIFRIVDTQYCKQNKWLSCHEEAPSVWHRRTILGLGSGEGLVAATAEPDEEVDRDEDDRRRLVFEEEFARPLTVMRREGCILSEILRAAWDGGVLASRTKGKMLRSHHAHIGILGHITESELRTQMTATEIFNGFVNRFLWFCTRRSKSLPFGGGRANTAPLISTLHAVLDFAREPREIEFDAETKRLWGECGLYDLLLERPAGLLGSVTGRAEVHVTRLALLYAVLDGAETITTRHLLAALAVWDYVERSCAYLFGRSTGDEFADVLEELLAEASPGWLTRTEMRDRFRRNAPPGRIPKALALLEREGRAERRLIPHDKGRPTEVWCATDDANRLRQNDINDKSPLKRARELTTKTT